MNLRRVLPILKLATKIADKIPARGDTLPQKVAKVLSLFDAANDVYGGGRGRMRELTDRYSLVERESETFVRLFFSTSLRDLFTLKRQQLDDREDLFSKSLGGRALKLDATSLAIVSVKEIGFLVETLRPAFLVIDDLDRADIAAVNARVLFLLERLKTHYPWMTVVLSVNDPAKLDAALLRCGRIDIPVEFGAPERDEVEQMVAGMCAGHGVRVDGRSVERIAIEAVSGQFTHAYLDDLCRRLRHEPLEDLIASIGLLKALAEKSAANGKSEPEPKKG